MEVFNIYRLLTGPQYADGAGDGYLKVDIIQMRAQIVEMNRSPRNWRVRQEEDRQLKTES